MRGNTVRILEKNHHKIVINDLRMVLQTKDEPSLTLTIFSLTIKSDDSDKKHWIKNCLKV